jgi:hypothetical protein
LKYQKLYSHLLPNNTHEFVVKWKQSEIEREDLVQNKDVFYQFVADIPSMPPHFSKK